MNPKLAPHQADILIATWEKLTEEPEYCSLIQLVTQAARELTHAENASLALIEGGNLCFVEFTGAEQRRVRKVKVRLGSGIAGKVAQDGVARRIRHGIYESAVSGIGNPPGQGNPARSLLCVPILFKGAPVGAIQVFQKQGADEFSPEDEHALQMLANQGAAGIERCRLHERLLTENRRIHGIFEALTDGIMVIDTDSNPLIYNQAVEKMFFPEGKQNFSLTTYLSSVIRGMGGASGSTEVVLFKPHNLILSNRYVTVTDADGNPTEIVVSIRNITDQRGMDRRFSQFYAVMLHKALRTSNKAVRARSWKDSRRYLERHREILRHLVFLTELKSGPMRIEKESCDLLHLYRKAKEGMRKKLSRKGFRLEDEGVASQGPLGGRFDRRGIAQVFRTLLAKAAQGLDRTGSLLVQVSHVKNLVRFQFDFSGKEIAAGINANSLDWNLQIDRIITGDCATLDLGLAFLGHVISAHKGSIEIGNDHPNHARVTFHIPLE